MPYTNAMACDATNSSPNCTADSSGDPISILSGYNAGTGYDQATGLGSLNVANVVNAWPASKIPLVSLSTAGPLTFLSTVVGTTDTTTQAITLKNTGTATLSSLAVSIAGSYASSFTQSNTCGTSVAAGATCKITVTFKPVDAGALTAQLSIADNATGSPQMVSLKGTATGPVVSLSGGPLSYVSTAVGIADPATQAITLGNTGKVKLSSVAISIAGTNASSFLQTNNCGTSVAAGGSCTITVTFKPTAIGELSAWVSVADNVAGSPQTVSLSGVGKAGPPVVSLSNLGTADVCGHGGGHGGPNHAGHHVEERGDGDAEQARDFDHRGQCQFLFAEQHLRNECGGAPGARSP